MMRLTITRNSQLSGATGSGYRYTLGMPGRDGETEEVLDVTNALTSLHLKMDAKKVNNIQVTFLVDDVDIKADVLAALQAFMGEREEANEELETTNAGSKTRTYIDPPGGDPE